MLQGLGGNYPLLRVVGQHFHQQIVALVIQHGVEVEVVAQVANARMLRHLDLLQHWQLLVLRPDRRVRRAKQFEDALDHLDRGVSGEERLHDDHLEENAADRPHVNRYRVLSRAKQQLRRPIPHRDDFMRIWPQRHGESASEAKVRNLNDAFVSEQDVLRLQVPMHDPVAVNRVDSLQDLREVGLDDLRQLRNLSRIRRQMVLVVLDYSR